MRLAAVAAESGCQGGQLGGGGHRRTQVWLLSDTFRKYNGLAANHDGGGCGKNVRGNDRGNAAGPCRSPALQPGERSRGDAGLARSSHMASAVDAGKSADRRLWRGFRSWQPPWAGVAGRRAVRPAVAPRGGSARRLVAERRALRRPVEAPGRRPCTAIDAPAGVSRRSTPLRRSVALCRRAGRTCTARLMPWPVAALDAVAAPGALPLVTVATGGLRCRRPVKAPGRALPASRPGLHRVDAVAASSRWMPSRRPARGARPRWRSAACGGAAGPSRRSTCRTCRRAAPVAMPRSMPPESRACRSLR